MLRAPHGRANTRISTDQFSLFRREFVGGRDFGALGRGVETAGLKPVLYVRFERHDWNVVPFPVRFGPIFLRSLSLR